MICLDDLAAQRQKFLDGLEANKGDINLDIWDDFYPDQAHFIFEVLQNAESVGATSACFTLTNDRCVFEHNGERHFNIDDVRAITGYHNTTKIRKPDEIGRFGIGFKSVFAYTETPIIYSKDVSFQIIKRVKPKAVPITDGLNGWTRFVFPFDSPSRSADIAYKDIKDGLERLPDTTLLFLTHLQSIRWQIGAESSGAIDRISHATNENYIEVQKELSGKVTSRHFLCFTEPVEGVAQQSVAIAFALSLLPKISEFDPTRPMAEQMRIVRTTGQVAVYFPAMKETSGLRFHLHAPFVPELSRASIKQTSANDPLFAQLARLSAASLHRIRDLGLLTGEFLEVLPNPNDGLPLPYCSIRDAIITEMKDQPLTPTRSGSHHPAKQLLRAKISTKDLLSEEDLNYLVKWKETPRWVIDVPEGSKQRQFLDGLDITKWDIDEFVDVLTHQKPAIEGVEQRKRRRLGLEIQKQMGSLSQGPDSTADIDRQLRAMDEPDPTFSVWLANKALDWHQSMYALLYRERMHKSRLQTAPIARLTGGRYSVGKGCYFPVEGVECDALHEWVDPGTYSSGNDTAEQSDARKLLEELGVEKYGLVAQVQDILKQRYTKDAVKPDDKTYLDDFSSFIELVEAQPALWNMFREYYIFKRECHDWGTPAQVFLDLPYQDTGLSAYFHAIGASAAKAALSDWYRQAHIQEDHLWKFALATGVQHQLSIVEVRCDWNDKKDYLHGAPGERSSRYGVDRDYYINSIDRVIDARDVRLSRLIWNTMRRESSDKLVAEYSKSRSSEPRRAPSLVINWLEDRAWIPQQYGDQVHFVKPREASRDRLPDGFPFDEDSKWLEAVHFGENERRQSEAYRQKLRQARELGFRDEETLSEGKWYANLSPEDRRRMKDEYERKQQFELPEHSPKNPDLRAERVAQEATEAPERITEKRMRSVSVGWEAVKQETAPYLREQYTKDGEMFCQVCKKPLPFKLDDGSFYFEAVEFLPDSALKKRHRANYLALCPNHAAMYQHANGSSNEMKTLFLEMAGPELLVILAQEDATIYFTETHLVDLRTVIETEDAGQPV